MFTKLSDRVVTAPTLALSAARSAFFRTALIATLAGGAMGMSAFPALAHSPSSSGTTSTITLNGTASFGGAADFTVTDPPVKWVQEVSVTCLQGGQQVYLDVHTQDQANWTHFNLWSQTWADAGGSSASCLAQFFYYTWQGKTETGVVVEAQTSFVTS